jgi:hypothetical protein
MVGVRLKVTAGARARGLRKVRASREAGKRLATGAKASRGAESEQREVSRSEGVLTGGEGGDADWREAGGVGHGGMPRWGAQAVLTRRGPTPQTGHRTGVASAAPAPDGSLLGVGRAEAAVAATTARSWRQRASLSWRAGLANSPKWRMRTKCGGTTWRRNRRRNSSAANCMTWVRPQAAEFL